MGRRGHTPARRWAAALALAGTAAVLIAHATSYLPFIADDALISLRYADRFLAGDGLTWTDGQRLEGYSNLLWILACSAVGALGVDLIVATRMLGTAFAVLALVAVFRAHPGSDESGVWPATVGAGSMALSGAHAVWAVGGLEQPLLAALLAWAAVLAYPLLRDDGRARAVPPAIPLALLCVTRPDGALFTAGFVLGLFLARRFDRRTVGIAVRLAILPAAAVVAQVTFRLVYYGEPIPNSAHAKLAWTLPRLLDGLAYVGTGVLYHAPLMGAWAWLALRTRDARVRFLAGPIAVWSAYLVAIGGDIFPGRRHLVPVVVLASLGLAAAVDRRLRDRPGERPRVRTAAIALGVALLVLQIADPETRRARVERWEWDGEVVGGVLRDAFSDREPLLAVDPAGTLPYFSGLPSLDMLGINDRHLARHPPDDFGHGPLGHELGDGSYVLDREPDLVLFCLPTGSARPCFRSGREMVRDPRFAARYRLVTVEGDRPYTVRSRIWFRNEGGAVGIERTGDRVVVPAYLFTGNPDTVARPGADGRLQATVATDTPAGYPGLRLPPGVWSVRVEPDRDVWRVAARDRGTERLLGAGANGTRVEVVGARPREVDIRVGLHASDGAGAFDRLVLEKVDGR